MSLEQCSCEAEQPKQKKGPSFFYKLSVILFRDGWWVRTLLETAMLVWIGFTAPIALTVFAVLLAARFHMEDFNIYWQRKQEAAQEAFMREMLSALQKQQEAHEAPKGNDADLVAPAGQA